MIRQPIRTLTMAILIAGVSFAFVNNVSEYVIAKDEINRLAKYYPSIGTLNPVNQQAAAAQGGGAPGIDFSQVKDYISNSKYVDYVDERRAVSGVMDGILNANVDGHTSDNEWVYDTLRFAEREFARGGFRSLSLEAAINNGQYDPTAEDGLRDYVETYRNQGVHISDVFIYCKILDIQIVKTGDIGARQAPLTKKEYGDEKSIRFEVEVIKLEAGYPDYFNAGNTVDSVLFLPLDTAGYLPGDSPLEGIEIGKTYFLKAYCQPVDYNATRFNIPLTIKPLIDDEVWYIPVEEGEYIDFEPPGMSAIKDELEVLRENLSTSSIVSTADMSAMPDTQQGNEFGIRLTEGRWLNRDDNINARPVCVINKDFAELRGLSLGSVININLRDMTGMLGLIRDMDADWRERATEKISVEVVGLYEFVYNPWNDVTQYSVSSYIPDSIMPADFSGGIPRVASFSFVLKSSKDEEAFLAESAEILAGMGVSVSFVENSRENFWSSADSLLRAKVLSAALYVSLTAFVMILLVFLYTRFRRKDFAVLRALGLPAAVSVMELAAPVLFIWLPALAIGGLVGGRFAMGRAAETLSDIMLQSGTTADTSLSILWFAGIIGAAFALLIFLTLAGGYHTARRPVLEILQGTEAKHDKQR
jgi:hypothetical protein